MGLLRDFAERNGFLDCDGVVVTGVRFHMCSDVGADVLAKIECWLHDSETNDVVCKLGTMDALREGHKFDEPLFLDLRKGTKDFNLTLHVMSDIFLKEPLAFDAEIDGYGITGKNSDEKAVRVGHVHPTEQVERSLKFP